MVGPTPSPLRSDVYLAPFLAHIERRKRKTIEMELRLTQGQSLLSFASGHLYYGLHCDRDAWIFREWAPNATAISLVGPFCGWDAVHGVPLRRLNDEGDWETNVPTGILRHGDPYRLHVSWPGGAGDRIPSYARRVIQDPSTGIFNAQVWAPEDFAWRHAAPNPRVRPLLIYETHVGIALEEGKVASYDEFRRLILPRVARLGYNTIQLMAVMEHPYYGSFGYHVGSFYAASSRFGSPEELKRLIDDAHGLGLAVIMDLVHSHAVRNEVEGLGRFDGTVYQYFHEGPRGYHHAWDSYCFDYAKPEVLHFLLSNVRFWLEEYRFDGFRFDGVTSMLYDHHGLGSGFGSYQDYFTPSVDEDAYVYLALANKLIHQVNPLAISVAEDVSGMPGLGASVEEGGCGFDCRLAMGVPDHWFKLAKERRDEDWHVEGLWHELTNRRQDERVISYVESHDQALVGGKTLIFELLDAAMYDSMGAHCHNPTIDRGIALHKLARLATFTTASHGYLNFMGNEFGHPEWIDFPREGNDWSYHYARRQWSLADDPELHYHGLAEFDRAMLAALGSADMFGQAPCLRYTHVANQILVYSRGPIVVLLCFHPTRSFPDYRVGGLAGRFELILNTDDSRFSGLGRVNSSQVFEGPLTVYLPTRTGLVLRQA